MPLDGVKNIVLVSSPPLIDNSKTIYNPVLAVLISDTVTHTYCIGAIRQRRSR